MSDKKIKAAIVGASGYTGAELARYLLLHPSVEISMITSESHAGKPFSTLHPQFTGLLDIPLVSAEEMDSGEPDVAFLALPHGVSMRYIKMWERRSFKMIDLSGDFRLKGPEVYEAWYNKEHTFAEGFKKAVYGLPEIHGQAIKDARLVANPGCYPTATILALAPLLVEDWVATGSIIADAKSGTTGAGIKPGPATHFATVNDNFKAYGIKSHRHTVEIEEQLSGLNINDVRLQFTPHLLPVDRGIFVTAYATPNRKVSQEELTGLYRDFYSQEPFVRVRSEVPSIKDVRASNFCDVHPVWDERTGRILIFSVIDNLVKGAAGQAIQNMNIMFGFNQGAGLKSVPVKP